MSSDALYTGCIDETLKFYSQHSDAPTYMYLFAYKGQNSLVNLLLDSSQTLFDTGVCHGDELFYLFDLKISSKRLLYNKDAQIRERMLTLWTDFAKYGYLILIQNLSKNIVEFKKLFLIWVMRRILLTTNTRVGNDLIVKASIIIVLIKT